jgi:Zn-dependent peptidase ImmA (M78 family)/formiminotetrahydrofolate cyclodeaminase
MSTNLLDLPANKLLEKFGAGNHKPGSGSAVAYHGLLTAQLIQTVIQLTTDESRSHKYEKSISKLTEIQKSIESSIYPKLDSLLHQDSAQFDKVISLRRSVKQEKDPVRKNQLATDALKELMPATEIPIQIADECIKLAEHAAFVFDYGFKSARGDSGVALNDAVACIAGCLSIIDLNLTSFMSDKWTQKIRQEANRLRSRYQELMTIAVERQKVLENEAAATDAFYTNIEKLMSDIQKKAKLSNAYIESVATRLLNETYIYKKATLKAGSDIEVMSLVDPVFILKKIKYQCLLLPNLGTHDLNGQAVETAGQIDKVNKVVLVSENFPKATQYFTLAHELGHALMHKQISLHRDKPIDGSALSGPRDLVEQQADKFASSFLMPQKQLQNIFKEIFLVDKIEMNEDTAYALNISLKDLRKRCKNLREFSLLIAGTNFLRSNPIVSLAERFNVSISAMAIRLEELKVVAY